MAGGAGREGVGHGPLQPAPAAHRRAEGLLLPRGLALRRRAAAGRGAIDDTRRIAEFIYRNLGALTDITTTMDTHFAYQIFFPSFWVDQDDQPLTAVPRDHARADRARRRCARTRRWRSGCAAATTRGCASRCSSTARSSSAPASTSSTCGRRTACSAATGTRSPGVVHEARLFHAFARGAQSWVEVKGGNPLTENYSVLRPEVLIAARRAAARAAQHAVPPDAAHRRTRWSSPGRPPATA